MTLLIVDQADALVDQAQHAGSMSLLIKLTVLSALIVVQIPLGHLMMLCLFWLASHQGI